MADINDLNFDYDDPEDVQDLGSFEDDESDESNDVAYNDDDDSSYSSDLIEDVLKSKGIEDIDRIKWEDDYGNITERSWHDLSDEEQRNILTDTSNPERDLDDAEIDFVNRMRLSKMGPNEYIQMMVQRGIADYVNSQQNSGEQYFIVDDYGDDELFMLDLQAKIEGITDEELEQALENAKSNESLYAKQINSLREEYKNLEAERNQRELEQQQALEQEQYQQTYNSIANSIRGFRNIGDLDVSMDDNDMQELASFMLDRDNTGMSYFGRALNDPDQAVRAAWVLLHGDDVFNSISDYYKHQISSVSKANYERGYNDAVNGNNPRVVIQQPKRKNSKNRAKSIGDFVY